MEYLIQFQVLASNLSYDDPIPFNYGKTKVKLFLNDIDLISKGKKIHFVLSAQNWEKALNRIWHFRNDLNHRLMFLFNKPLVIFPCPEFIIWGQESRDVRNIHFWDIDLSDDDFLDSECLKYINNIMSLEIGDLDLFAMEFYNEALQMKLPTAQYKALHLAMEELIPNEQNLGKCPKCGATLNPSVSNSKIDEFLEENADAITVFGMKKYMPGKEHKRLRGKLNHPPKKRGIIDVHQLYEAIKELSVGVRSNLERKYSIDLALRGIGKSTPTFQDFREKYITEKPKEEFALDIPPIDEYLNQSDNTRWIIDKLNE